MTDWMVNDEYGTAKASDCIARTKSQCQIIQALTNKGQDLKITHIHKAREYEGMTKRAHGNAVEN